MDYLKGDSFYDEKGVFEKYINHRKWAENPNKAIEKPIFLDLLSGVQGAVLDISCGYGDISKDLIELGIEEYTGIDASLKMIELGKSQINSSKIKLIDANLESWDYGASKYDWIISRLVFHYVLDLQDILLRIHKGLKANGQLVFSVEHPILTSSMDIPREPGKKKNWLVDNYFKEGERKQDWLENRVIKYHRTLETYWKLLNNSGFRIEAIKEGCPEQKYFQHQTEYERRRKIPLFLIIKAMKS